MPCNNLCYASFPGNQVKALLFYLYLLFTNGEKSIKLYICYCGAAGSATDS